MEWLPHIAAITVALIAALSGYLTQRQASKANRQAQVDSVRANSEVEAFNRARAFDVGTIDRQNNIIEQQAAKIKEQSVKIDEQDDRIEELEKELGECKRGLANAENS